MSLIEEVDRCCEKITELEQNQTNGPARIDFLVLSHADLHFGGRRETTEGLDKSMSLLYYSRIRSITQLMPLFTAFPLPAHVVSVFGGGSEGMGKLFPEDLSLRDLKHFSFSGVRTHVTYMKTMAFERIAQQHPDRISLVHVFPGLVIGPTFYSKSLPLWFRIIWRIFGPIAKIFAISPEETGERIIGYASTGRFPARTQKDQTEGMDLAVVAKSTDVVVGGGA